jgi:hypothetical protein
MVAETTSAIAASKRPTRKRPRTLPWLDSESTEQVDLEVGNRPANTVPGRTLLDKCWSLSLVPMG